MKIGKTKSNKNSMKLNKEESNLGQKITWYLCVLSYIYYDVSRDSEPKPS